MVAGSCIFTYIHAYSFISVHVHPHLFIFIHIHSYASTHIHIHAHPFMLIHDGPVSPTYSVSWFRSSTPLFYVLCLMIEVIYIYIYIPMSRGRGVSLCFILCSLIMTEFHQSILYTMFYYIYIYIYIYVSFTFVTGDQEIWEKAEILTWKIRKKADFSLKNCMFVSTIFQHFPMRPPFALFFSDKYWLKQPLSKFLGPQDLLPQGEGRAPPGSIFFRSLNLYIRSWIRSCSHNHCCHDKVQTKFRPILQTNTWD